MEHLRAKSSILHRCIHLVQPIPAYAFCALFLFLGILPSFSFAARPGDRVTVQYLNGSKETITIGRITPKYISVKTKSGVASIFAKDLSDATLKTLGMEEELRHRRVSKQKADYDMAQVAKGLVQYQGKWVTPGEKKVLETQEADRKQELAFQQDAQETVLLKAKRSVSFQVIQALDYGSLCVIGRPAYVGAKYFVYDGEIFFWSWASKTVVAEEETYFADILYWTGTETYETVQRKTRTVNSYSMDQETAVEIIRTKFDMFDATAKSSRQPEPFNKTVASTTPRGFGTGFFVTKDGYFITNYHVVKDASKVQIKTKDEMLDAKIIELDLENDLALLKVGGQHTPVSFASGRSATLGQTVFTVGFPLPGLQGFSPKVTKGVISSLRGLQDDVRNYQIDASVQPGNSGGPLADEGGNVVGVVVARISDNAAIEASGAIPQNVNYAVKKSYLLAFLDIKPAVAAAVEIREPEKQASFENAVKRVSASTCMVVVY